MKMFGFVLAVLLLGTSASAAERVNSKESLRQCKSAMAADTPKGTKYKFKRNTATSVDSDSFKHWINFLEVSDTGKSSKKLMCETSRTGEILVLEIKPGRWKI